MTRHQVQVPLTMKTYHSREELVLWALVVAGWACSFYLLGLPLFW